LVFWEEESFDSETESLWVDRWDRFDGPVEIHVVIDLGFTLLVGDELVKSWRN